MNTTIPRPHIATLALAALALSLLPALTGCSSTGSKELHFETVLHSYTLTVEYLGTASGEHIRERFNKAKMHRFEVQLSHFKIGSFSELRTGN